MVQINKNNKTYCFLELGKKVNYEKIINWLELNNAVYVPLPLELRETDFTGIIKIFSSKNIILEIKIYEGYYILINDYINKINCYIEDSKITLEIREYENTNKIDVNYIYDKFILTNNNNNTYNILYKDTMKQDDFDMKDISLNRLSENQKIVYDKFLQIIKETKLKINKYTDSIVL